MSGPTDAPARILIIQTAFIGDAILATSLLEALHNRWPDANIDLLVRKGNESLFTGHPFLHKVLTWEKRHAKYRHWWRLLLQIRRERYELVCTLQRFAAAGLLTALSGARWRVGFSSNPAATGFTHRIPHDIRGQYHLHEIERNYQLLADWLPAISAPLPRLYPSEADFYYVQRKRPYVCLAPTSVWFTKQWPKDRWIELVQKLPADLDVLLLGGPDDQATCEHIAHASGYRAQNLAGTLSLLQSAALMAGARMNYVNDSAPLHICSAMDAPVTAIFCSTVPQFGFGPLSSNRRIVETSEDLDCRPCGLHGKKACPQGHFRCADISVERVIGDDTARGLKQSV